MNTNTNTAIEVAIHASRDLNEAGLCNCAACCEAFADACADAAEGVAAALGVEIQVVFGESFDSTALELRAWQMIQDAVCWDATDAPADCESR